MLSGCKTYEIMHYEVLRPAKFSVPPEIKSIVVVDNSYTHKINGIAKVKVDDKVVSHDTVAVDTFASVLISQLKEELLQRFFFDTVYYDTIRYNYDTGKPLKMLDNAEVKEICSEYGAEAVLALGDVKYSSQINLYDIGEGYYSTMDIRGQLFWRLYDNLTNQVIYSNIQYDTIYWEGYGSGMNSSVSSFPSLKKGTVELADYMGRAFGNNIAPHWEHVKRKVYTTGSPLFVSAAEWLNKENRYEAEKIWGYIYEHGTNLEKGRAANNIAVSAEVRGEVKIASEWAYKSYNAYKEVADIIGYEEREYVKRFYSELAKRLREMKKLDRQVGGD